MSISEKNTPSIKTDPELTQIIELEDHKCKVTVKVNVAPSCRTLCNLMDCTAHGIL